MQIALVKFRDPSTIVEWASKSEVDRLKCKVCLACGFLLEENEDVTKVALLAAQDKEAYSDWIVIPNGCILSCEVLKEIDWEANDGS